MTTQLSTCCLQPVRTRFAPLSEEDVYQYECTACGKLCDLLPAEATSRCPKCGSLDFVKRHHSGTFALPECDFKECEDCNHQWDQT